MTPDRLPDGRPSVPAEETRRWRDSVHPRCGRVAPGILGRCVSSSGAESPAHRVRTRSTPCTFNCLRMKCGTCARRRGRRTTPAMYSGTALRRAAWRTRPSCRPWGHRRSRLCGNSRKESVRARGPEISAVTCPHRLIVKGVAREHRRLAVIDAELCFRLRRGATMCPRCRALPQLERLPAIWMPVG